MRDVDVLIEELRAALLEEFRQCGSAVARHDLAKARGAQLDAVVSLAADLRGRAVFEMNRDGMSLSKVATALGGVSKAAAQKLAERGRLLVDAENGTPKG